MLLLFRAQQGHAREPPAQAGVDCSSAPCMVMWLNMVGDLYQRNAQLPHHGVQPREAHV
jgi:hypothetical protein